MEKLTHINQLKAASEGATNLMNEINSSLEELAPKLIELRVNKDGKFSQDYITKETMKLNQAAKDGPLTNLGKLKAMHEQVNSSASHFTKDAILSRQQYFDEFKPEHAPVTSGDKMTAELLKLQHSTAEDTRRTRLITEIGRLPNAAIATEIKSALETNDLMKLSVAIQEHRVRNYGEDSGSSKASVKAIDDAMKALDFPEFNSAQTYISNVEEAYREASMTYDKVVKGKNTAVDKIALGLVKGEDGMNVKKVA